MAKDVYWHLPGFCYNRFLFQILMNLMKDHPECFREGYKIGSVYGSFPGAIWNGGRVVYGFSPKEEIEKLLEMYNQRNVPVRFTWTNSLIEEKHTYDTFCNLIMRLADNGMNQVLVNNPVLEAYLRREYPNFKYICSTTRRIVDLEGINKELEKDYFMVVLDYDMNHDEEALKSLESQAERVEILVDEICFPKCPRRTEHYNEVSRLQLEFSVGKNYDCHNLKDASRNFEECMSRPSFISCEEIDSYIERGFVNFKLVGRGLSEQYVKDSIIYYMVKDEHKDFIRNRFDETLADIRKAQKLRR